ncbi:hypothetical protein SIID45300_01673 [Candidatus Magnetaquicoccaceae bacterium FCR-1]|uniref:DUF1640 domain-containing protein n=1 Tax=Candidatus Magnetaquiglobus chichijimensis TaxID=3141448 RepID=A0ABQ0C8Y2_9PROT
MTVITFDTHAFIKELKAAGFTEAQAEAQTKILSSVFKTNLEELATRRDLKELELTLKAELRKDIETAKAETIKWMFGVAAGQAVFIVTLFKMFPGH